MLGKQFLAGVREAGQDRLFDWIRRLEQADQSRLEPAAALARSWVLAYWVEQTALAKYQAGSIGLVSLVEARRERLKVELALVQSNAQPEQRISGVERVDLETGQAPAFLTQLRQALTEATPLPTDRDRARMRVQVARLDRVQAAERLLEVARERLQAATLQFLAGHAEFTLNRLLQVSLRVLEAEQHSSRGAGDPRVLLEGQFGAALEDEQLVEAKYQAGALGIGELQAARHIRLRAQEALLLEGQVRPASRRRDYRPEEWRLQERWLPRAWFSAAQTPLPQLRQDLLDTAEAVYLELRLQLLAGGRLLPTRLGSWSIWLLEAGLDLDQDRTSANRLLLAAQRRAFATQQILEARYRNGSVGILELTEANFDRVSSALRWLQSQTPGRSP